MDFPGCILTVRVNMFLCLALINWRQDPEANPPGGSGHFSVTGKRHTVAAGTQLR